MIVKITKQLGNFKRGINLYVPKKRSSSAPSGIPVATVNLVINFGSGDPRNGTYSGGNETWVNYGFNGNYRLKAPNTVGNVTWTFFDDDNYVEVSPSNPSTDANYIPTTGWVYTIGSGPTVTITAA